MTKKRFGMVLPITLLSYFLILMDNSIIFTSATQIGDSLRLTPTDLSWISSAYTLTFGGFLLLSSRLSDLIGRKQIFLIGMTIFGFSSLIIGLSNNATVVITMRAIQGIGSSIIAPSTLALIMDTYQGEMREKAIAYYGATAGLGTSLGLVIGGGLTTLFTWQAGFLINVPITLLLFILTIFFVPKKNGIKTSIDYMGALLSVIGLAMLIDGLTSNQVVLMVLGVFLLSVFIIFESKQKEPILPLLLFKDKVRNGAYLARLFFMMAMLPYWFFVPQVLQKSYHFSALLVGIAFFPLTLVMFIISMYLPKLTKLFNNGNVLLMGECFLLIGMIWTALSNLSTGYWLAIAIPMLFVGVGQGMILAPVTSAGLNEVPQSLAGIASGVTNTAHQIGGPIGLSLIVSTTNNYHGEMTWITVFTAFALFVVAIFVVNRK